MYRPGVLSAGELFLRENDLHEVWRLNEAEDTLEPIRGLVVTVWLDDLLRRHFPY